jgi:hypothetical protein
MPQSRDFTLALVVLVSSAAHAQPLQLVNKHQGDSFLDGTGLQLFLLIELMFAGIDRMGFQCFQHRSDTIWQHTVRGPGLRLQPEYPSNSRSSYVDKSTAQESGLVQVNAAGNVIIKVDNSTNDPNPGIFSTFGRNTVMIISKDTIDLGTLVVMDAVHIPYGVRSSTFICSETN